MPDLLIKGFDALQYVTNPYALFGFVFLAGIVVIGLIDSRQRTKAFFLAGFAILALGATYMLIETTLTGIKRELLVHLVRGNERQLVSPGVEVELIDIETLKGKGKKDWDFNRRLQDFDHVSDEIFTRAGLTRDGSDTMGSMDASGWAQFLKELENSQDVGESLQAEKIKDIPFAKFRVYVDGAEDPGFGSRYFFKNETLCIPSGSNGCERAKLKVVNLYNTKHNTSDEREAANIRVLEL